MTSARLSKTDYTSGLQCTRRLWLRRNEREASAPPPPSVRVRQLDGERVDRYAQVRYPGGVLIRARGLNAAASETRRALASGKSRIYQATFITEWGGCMVDILDVREDGSLELREVKSTARVKQMHVHDAGFQIAVVEACGWIVSGLWIVRINPSSRAPELHDYFVEEDVRDAAREAWKAGPLTVRQFQEIVDGDAPTVEVGPHCVDPYPCPFHSACWQGVPDDSIAALPGLKPSARARLEKRGIHRIGDVPLPTRLPKAARVNVLRYASVTAPLDARVLGAWDTHLLYPLHLLTLTTDPSPLPELDGVRPFEAIPVHVHVDRILSPGVEPERLHALHRLGGDPRPLIGSALRGLVGDVGHIVVLSADRIRAALATLRRGCSDSSWFFRADTRLHALGPVAAAATGRHALSTVATLEDWCRLLVDTPLDVAGWDGRSGHYGLYRWSRNAADSDARLASVVRASERDADALLAVFSALRDARAR